MDMEHRKLKVIFLGLNTRQDFSKTKKNRRVGLPRPCGQFMLLL